MPCLSDAPLSGFDARWLQFPAYANMHKEFTSAYYEWRAQWLHADQLINELKGMKNV